MPLRAPILLARRHASERRERERGMLLEYCRPALKHFILEEQVEAVAREAAARALKEGTPPFLWIFCILWYSACARRVPGSPAERLAHLSLVGSAAGH